MQPNNYNSAYLKGFYIKDSPALMTVFCIIVGPIGTPTKAFLPGQFLRPSCQPGGEWRWNLVTWVVSRIWPWKHSTTTIDQISTSGPPMACEVIDSAAQQLRTLPLEDYGEGPSGWNGSERCGRWSKISLSMVGASCDSSCRWIPDAVHNVIQPPSSKYPMNNYCWHVRSEIQWYIVIMRLMLTIREFKIWKCAVCVGVLQLIHSLYSYRWNDWATTPLWRRSSGWLVILRGPRCRGCWCTKHTIPTDLPSSHSMYSYEWNNWATTLLWRRSVCWLMIISGMWCRGCWCTKHTIPIDLPSSYRLYSSRWNDSTMMSL